MSNMLQNAYCGHNWCHLWRHISVYAPINQQHILCLQESWTTKNTRWCVTSATTRSRRRWHWSATAPSPRTRRNWMKWRGSCTQTMNVSRLSNSQTHTPCSSGCTSHSMCSLRRPSLSKCQVTIILHLKAFLLMWWLLGKDSRTLKISFRKISIFASDRHKTNTQKYARKLLFFIDEWQI